MATSNPNAPEPPFRRFVEKSAAGMWHIDRAGHTIYANPSMLELLQVAALEDLKGQSFERFFTPESTELIRREHVKRLRGEATSYEVELVGQAGRHLLVAVNGQPLRDEEDAIAGMVGTFIDITESKQARRKVEDDLANANSRLLVHMEETPLAMLECDTQLRILRWSRPAERMFGWPAEEFVGRHIASVPLVHPDDVTVVLRRVESLIAGRALTTHHTNRNRTRDGRVLVCEWYSSVVKNERGEIESILGLAHDVTQQKHAEEAVRESQRTLFTLLGNLPGMAYRCRDRDRRSLEFVSEGCRNLTGYSAVELKENLYFEDLTHPDDRAAVRRDIEQALGQLERFELTYRLNARDGSVRWVWERGTGVYDSKGALLAIEGFITDITRQRRLEDELRHAQKMECVGRLAGGVAHDFNNILTVIQGHSALIGENSSDAVAVRDSAREVAQAVERAANLTRQLLTFSRRQAMKPQEVDLNDAIADMLKMLRRLLGADVAVRFHGSTAPVIVRADAGMLHQVLMNLAVNARDAMPVGGVLSIQVGSETLDEEYVRDHSRARAGSFAVLEVVDTGCGISAEHLPRIFEPFFTTKDVGKGTGLGLATVYGIVEQHHGWIDVESHVGAGTTFRIFLPSIAVPKRVPEPSAPLASVRGGGETILVVDDEAELLSLIQRILQALGYKIVSASSGVEALEVWKQHGDAVDLLLTDLVMPDGLNGRELADRLQERKPRLRTIFSSGYSLQVLGREFSLQPHQRFLQKPYSPKDLARVVRECLDANGIARAATHEQ